MTLPDNDKLSSVSTLQADRLPLDAVCGEIDIRIDATGLWHYHGSPIGRKELVRLFSTVLQRDEKGDFWLITPVEKGRIQVEDAPFMAIIMTVTGKGDDQSLLFETNVGDTFAAGPDHPIHVEINPKTDEPSPYVRVRGSDNAPLDAKISRAVFYDVVELAVERDTDDGPVLGVWSGGCFYIIGALETK